VNQRTFTPNTNDKSNPVPTINHNNNTNAESNANPTCESLYEV